MTTGKAPSAFEVPHPDNIGSAIRDLLFLTCDQLHLEYLTHAGLDPARDLLLLIESCEDFIQVPSHKQRTTLFLSSMRHFAIAAQELGYRVAYLEIDDPRRGKNLVDDLMRIAQNLQPRKLRFFRPGDWRTYDHLRHVESRIDCSTTWYEDPHFLTTPSTFSAWAEGRKVLVLEHFYRWLRRRTGTLVNDDQQPEGGRWNFDRDNRRSLGTDAPTAPPPLRFDPDPITLAVMDTVESLFPDAPGSTLGFGWPVNCAQAREALADFVEHRLPWFGTYQDAMAKDTPWLFHSLLSPALNLKLLDPRECIAAAVAAYEEGRAPLNAVEGFVRQILGWREFIRGIYWFAGRDYASLNHLEQTGQLPHFYWTGDTDLVCVHEALRSVLRYGYGHHIQRLMITGNLALTSGVRPQLVGDWYQGMYVDALAWVTLPNTLGMVMFADGGLVGSKPYAASGKYVDRMSDYCRSCRFAPAQRHGDLACPLTTFYWDFLARNRSRLATIPRFRPMLRNLDRLSAEELQSIGQRAEELRLDWGVRQAD